MPTYDYECRVCGHKFELFQAITSKPAAECPKCKSDAKRLIGSGAGIIFKGSGFYQTDYKNKSVGEKRDDKAPSCPMDKGCKGCPASEG